MKETITELQVELNSEEEGEGEEEGEEGEGESEAQVEFNLDSLFNFNFASRCTIVILESMISQMLLENLHRLASLFFSIFFSCFSG